MNMDNLRRLGTQFKITLPTDELRLRRRQCRNADCKGYFKVMFGTGLQGAGATTCDCPYCGHN